MTTVFSNWNGITQGRSSRPDVTVKKVVLEILQFFLNLETLAQVFFREVKEISKNTFSYKTPLVSIYQ